MDNPTFVSPARFSLEVSAVGLLISDTATGRLGILTLLCGGHASQPAAALLSAIPHQAAKGDVDRRLAWRMRALAPIVGEAEYFAQRQPGGIALRKDDFVAAEPLPSVVVLKKVTTNDWSAIMERAEGFWAAVSSALPQVARKATVESTLLDAGPDAAESPELTAFRGSSLALAGDWLARRAAEGAPSSVSQPRNPRP